MDIFGLNWIPEAIKDLIDKIVELYEEVTTLYQAGKYTVGMIKDAVTTYMPTMIQSALLTLISIAIIYKILGREG